MKYLFLIKNYFENIDSYEKQRNKIQLGNDIDS